MSALNPPSALRAIRANADAGAVLRDLSAAFADFRAKSDSRVAALEAEVAKTRTDAQAAIDAAAQDRAALIIGGDHGGAAVPSAALRSAYSDLTAAVRTGAPRAGMHTESGPDGGFAVPREIDADILRLIRDRSPLRRLATIARAGTSEYRKLVTERGAAAGWRGERDDVMETDAPLLRALEPPIGECFAYPSVTNTMLADASFDVAAFLREEVIEKFAAQESAAFVGGTGSLMPRGFLTHPTAAQADGVREWGTIEHVATGNPGGFATDDPADELVDVMFKLRGEHRADPSCGWLMNSSTLAMVRKFKDAEGNYLWQPSMSLGQPSLLLGFPVYVDEEMPSIADGNTPIAFANWRRAYLIVDRSETGVIVDRVTKPGWTRMFFSRRVGGHVMDFGAVKLLKIGA